VKDTSGNASALTELVQRYRAEVTVLNGWDSMSLIGFLAGVRGTIWGGAVNVMPGSLRRALEARGSGPGPRGREGRVDRIWPVISFFETHPYTTSIKAGCDLIGESVGPARRPFLPLDAQALGQLRQLLVTAGVLPAFATPDRNRRRTSGRTMLVGASIGSSSGAARPRSEVEPMATPIFQVDAFTNVPYTGNPAGVCILAAAREPEWMLSVAREMNCSETAFAVQRRDGFDLRWFGVSARSNCAGTRPWQRPTFYWETGRLEPDAIARFQTRSGSLTATRKRNLIELDFPTDPVSPIDPPQGLAEALG